MKAKAILYTLIGSSLLFTLFYMGRLVYPLVCYPLMCGRSTGPVGDGLLGILIIAIGTIIVGFSISIAYQIGKWIMEKLS